MSESATKAMSQAEFRRVFYAVKVEMAKAVIGQEHTVEHILSAVFAGGHVLIRGMPGLGRTLIVKTLAEVMGLEYRRLQFTPDLLPTDIIGTEVLEGNEATGERNFRFFKGPVFANLLLVDEVNRSPARTQSALLEVMQERQVTAGGTTYYLPKPFVLVATENTLETEGVWPLGEAQADRFMMSINQDYPAFDEERLILKATTGAEPVTIQPVATPEIVLAMQQLARQVPVVPSVRDFAIALVRASRAEDEHASTTVANAVRLGASPRAAQALMLGGKVLALARGRSHVTMHDIAELAYPVLGHRILLDFRAVAGGMTTQKLVQHLIRAAYERAMPKVSRWTQEHLAVPA